MGIWCDIGEFICTRYLQLHGGVKKEKEKKESRIGEILSETCKKSGEYFGKDLVTRQHKLSHITTERLMKRIKRGPD